MLHFAEKDTDTPDIQYQADKTSQTDYNGICVQGKPFPGDNDCFKNDKRKQQVLEEYFSEEIIKENND